MVSRRTISFEILDYASRAFRVNVSPILACHVDSDAGLKCAFAQGNIDAAMLAVCGKLARTKREVSRVLEELARTMSQRQQARAAAGGTAVVQQSPSPKASRRLL